MFKTNLRYADISSYFIGLFLNVNSFIFVYNT